MEVNKQNVNHALDKVVYRLMNLAPPGIETDGSEASIKKGVIARDFGIEEWDWPQGVGLYGLFRLSECRGTEEYDKFFYDWFSGNLNRGLPSRNVNTTVPLLTLADLCDNYKEERFKELCVDWAEWLMKDLPRTNDGAFQHVTSSTKNRNEVALNEGEMWIDTLFMMVLFLLKMGVKHNNTEWIDEAKYQFLVHIKYLYEKKNGLFHHGWSFKENQNENQNFGGVFWCRGNSWYTLGLIEFIIIGKDMLDESFKRFTINSYKAQVDALLKLQDNTGLWHTVLDDPESYLETSGSASIAAGILKGVRYGILADEYRAAGLKAISALLDQVGADGVMQNVSGGTHVGYSKEHYKNIITAPMAYGQSLSIIAFAESLYHL